jgi:hypothetical protein
LRQYQQQFAYATANTVEFKTLLEQMTGKDFTQVFNQWFYGEGYPTFDVKWNQVNDTLYLKSKQTTSSVATPLFVTPVELLVKRSIGDTIIRVNQQQNDQLFKIPLKGAATFVQLDPNNWIINQATVLKDININGTNELGLAQINFRYYPNPASSTITIESVSQPIQSAQITDITGKQILTSINSVIDIASLQQGIYILTIKTVDGRTSAGKLLIKN